jgi:hypothetical protein
VPLSRGWSLRNGQVLFSQLRAGMWRRNGDTLVRNAWFYRSSYFYDFGFDLDIFLLQVCPWLWTGPPAHGLPCDQLRCVALRCVALRCAAGGGGGTACALVGFARTSFGVPASAAPRCWILTR